MSIIEFLRFVTSQEDCRIKWFESVREVNKLKKLLDEVKIENVNLDLKLTTARKLLDQERARKIRAEEDKSKVVSNLNNFYNYFINSFENYLFIIHPWAQSNHTNYTSTF